MHDDIDILYTRFGSMVFRRCESLLKNEEDAIDATHELFAKLIEREELMIETPSSYLYVAATRLCLNRIRSKKRHPEHGDELLDTIAHHGSENQSIAGNLLAKLFERQPDTTRVIAVLHHVDGLTLEETATEVGMSTSGVRTRLRSLRSALEILVEER